METPGGMAIREMGHEMIDGSQESESGVVWDSWSLLGQGQWRYDVLRKGLPLLRSEIDALRGRRMEEPAAGTVAFWEDLKSPRAVSERPSVAAHMARQRRAALTSLGGIQTVGVSSHPNQTRMP